VGDILYVHSDSGSPGSLRRKNSPCASVLGQSALGGDRRILHPGWIYLELYRHAIYWLSLGILHADDHRSAAR
jgi:hypothetical protein